MCIRDSPKLCFINREKVSGTNFAQLPYTLFGDSNTAMLTTRVRHLFIIPFSILLTFNGWTQSRQGFIPVNDGQLYYEKIGSGPPVVFLHGICLDHRMWQQQIDYFSKSYTCINVDLRGFGKSSFPGQTPYSFHEDIKVLLDSLHTAEPVVLIALSMGGKAAVNFSLAYPKQTKALVLADAAIDLSLIHISEPTRLLSISYAVF